MKYLSYKNHKFSEKRNKYFKKRNPVEAVIKDIDFYVKKDMERSKVKCKTPLEEL
jgi:hypothetical protein